MQELNLSDFGLETLAAACARKGWAVPTAQKWVQKGLLPVVVIGTGRSAKHLVRPRDVDAFTPPPRGRPALTPGAQEKPKAVKKGKK